MSTSGNNNAASVLGAIVAVIVALFLVVALLLSVIAGFKTFGRYQARQDAKNKITVVERQTRARLAQISGEIAVQTAQVDVVKQQANQRLEEAKGIRLAQDEINATLTPLYVQHEAIQAQLEIAKSGTNATVIYLPSGAGGVPTITADAASGR